MKQTNLKTRLGKRLKALYHAIPENTEHFFDLCCDHGALGRAVLESKSDCHVTFNDIRPGIIQSLADLLVEYQAQNYTLNTGPAQHIPLPATGQTTVMLAGIGDEQAIDILKQFLNQPCESACQMIISPATKVHYVRAFLNKAPVSLMEESLVTENRRTYEIITVRKDASNNRKQVSEFGTAWLQGDTDHEQHLNKLIQFYDAQQKQNRTKETTSVVEHYKKILKKISGPT